MADLTASSDSGNLDPNPPDPKHDGLYLACDYPPETNVMQVGRNGSQPTVAKTASFALGVPD